MNPHFQATTAETHNAACRNATTLPPGWLSPGMRRLAWGALLASSAIASLQAVELTLAALRGGLDGAWLELAVRTGVLAVLPMALAFKACALLRRRGNALESGHVDPGTGLYNRVGMVVRGNELLASCRRDNRVMAMVVFNFNDLLEVRNMYGARIYRQLMAKVARKMGAVAGDRGLAVRTGAAQFTLLIPGVGRDKALHAVERLLGSPSRIELETREHEIILVPELMADIATSDTGSVEELYVEMCADLTRLQMGEERRRQYIQRERESHSRPMELQVQAEHRPARSRRPVTAYEPVMPQTMPAPLAMS